jgi:methanogenic corrinoid protein MtbC1
MSMKNSNDNINTAKELQDAMVAFSSSLTRTMIEAQTKAWEEMMRFSGTATKIATESAKEFPFVRNFPGFPGK